MERGLLATAALPLSGERACGLWLTRRGVAGHVIVGSATRQRRALAAGHGLSGRSYRMMNELPTLLMVVIVISVIVKF